MGNYASGQTKVCPFCAEDIQSAAVMCKHCGSEFAGVEWEHEFERGRCIRCGVSTTNAFTYKSQCKPVRRERVSEPREVDKTVSVMEPEREAIRCPKCTSAELTAQKQGFGLGKAVVGGVLTGGVGLLAGFLGSGKIKITCLRCGHFWTPS